MAETSEIFCSDSEHSTRASEATDDSRARTRAAIVDISSSSSSKFKRKRSKSKYELLEDKMNSKFDAFGGKLDQMFNLFQNQNCTVNGDKNSDKGQSQRRPDDSRTQSLLDDVNVNSEDDEDRISLFDDNLSIRPRTGERLGVDSDNESVGDTKSTDEEHLSDKTRKCLFDLFGDDALTKKAEAKLGIQIDESQKQVLLNSWRSTNPNSVSAFAEDNKEDFPVHEETEKYLQVPSIDDLIGRCLIKKHGRKAAFTKTGKSLFSQPSKMIEKIAYRGQQAAYMGISMHMYMQQGLPALIQTLQSDDVNTDRAIQQARDIFAISTKSLDQFGRTGAFHHIIRRQLAMTDTGLYDLDDSRELSNLPLSGDGIFGSELEKFLKARKEKNKTLDDLLPDFPKKNLGKRKANNANSEASVPKKSFNNKEKSEVSNINNDHSGFNSFKGGLGNRNFEKKGQFDNKGQNSRPNNFRIPKFNKSSSAHGTRGGKTAGR